MTDEVISLAQGCEGFDDAPVLLTPTEARILSFLRHRPGQAFTRREILEGIHTGLYAIADRAIDVQILGLRRKLGPLGKAIETVRGVGYRFVVSPGMNGVLPSEPSRDDAAD